jgi:hypothetical protein
MSAFASKFAAKSSTTAARAAKQPRAKRVVAERDEATPVEPINVDAMRMHAEHVAQAQDEFTFVTATPSGTRQLIGTLAWMLTYASSFYWGLVLTDMLLVAAAAFTSSGFLLFLVAFVGLMMAVVGGISLASSAYKFVIEFNPGTFAAIGHDIKASTKSKVSLVRGWFTNTNEVAA